MAQATINARLNATVKERGDKVLRDNGISTTEAIRGLWSSMARTREVPSFLVRECKCDETAERRCRRTSLPTWFASPRRRTPRAARRSRPLRQIP